MAITRTHLHYKRIIDQIERNLVGLQLDMARNASEHRAMALAGEPALVVVSGYITDCVARYTARLGYIVAIRAHPAWPDIRAAYVAMGGSEAAAVGLYQELKAVVDALAVAPRANAAEIVAACDAVIAACDAPLSLWAE